MGFLKRLAYDLGLVLGLVAVSAAGAVALTYLFTGKLISIRSDKQGTRIVLESPDALAALIRQQVGKARAAAPAIELTLGEENGEA
jgi:Na+-translocating ferredoxin:NAD+ oxidoreductase RnfG subunit